MEEEEIAKAYDRVGEFFYKTRMQKKLLNELVEMPAMLSLLTGIRGKRVLDLGCGPGIYAKILKGRGAEVYGIDLSSKEIEIARSHVSGVDFRVGSAYDLPYKSGSFDLVVSALVVEHFGDVDKAFREVRRVLKRDGVFVFSIINPVTGVTHSMKGRPKNQRKFDDYFEEGKVESYWWRKLKHETMMTSYHRTYQSWIRAILRNGFTIVDYLDGRADKRRRWAKAQKRRFGRFMTRIPYICVFKVRAS